MSCALTISVMRDSSCFCRLESAFPRVCSATLVALSEVVACAPLCWRAGAFVLSALVPPPAPPESNCGMSTASSSGGSCCTPPAHTTCRMHARACARASAVSGASAPPELLLAPAAASEDRASEQSCRACAPLPHAAADATATAHASATPARTRAAAAPGMRTRVPKGCARYTLHALSTCLVSLSLSLPDVFSRMACTSSELAHVTKAASARTCCAR
mmetsp:Transcript_6335/g.25504  ORF Transcript_6335/g.25504 Transcript_6335/m.25504 type:complete len:217 (+) Transcript_6335:4725-5375(+)